MRILTALKISVLLTLLLATPNRMLAVSYRVTSDTSALIGDPSGPFSLDFQFIDGSGLGDGNNTVGLGNFDFGGGSWVGTDPGMITMTDTTFFSEFFQEFTPGSSLAFDLTFSTAVDASGVPDAFSFAILDGSLFEIPTDGLADALLMVDIDSASPSVLTFASDLAQTSIDIPAPTIAPVHSVPETLNSSLWLGAAFCLLIGMRSAKAMNAAV